MSIDISTDLIIVLQAQNIETPTTTGVYDLGSPPGTYIPGKDFSPADNVSTGGKAQLNFSISFRSIGRQTYNLDKIYIQSADDPHTDGTGKIPGRWSNTVSDPTHLMDDGRNAIIPNYNANMSSVVFDAGANIKSNSTISTSIDVALPDFGFWWKSKIVPKIQVVAEKDGIKKASEPFQLPEIILSTTGIFNSTLQSAGNIVYSAEKSRSGFTVPLVIFSQKENHSNIKSILDNPDFDLITYQIDFTAAVNEVDLPLTSANFIAFSSGFAQVVSVDYAAGVLTTVMRQTDPGPVSVQVNAFLPFNAAGMDMVTVEIQGTWKVSPPAVTGFVNEYLFTQSAGGSASQTAEVNTSQKSPVPLPLIQKNIYGSLTRTVEQNAIIQNYSCFHPQNSVMIRMMDSEIASFGSGLTLTYSFTDTEGSIVEGTLPAGSYTALYGHHDFRMSYDPNFIAQQVMRGLIPVMSYDALVNSGKEPNVLVITILKDLYDGYAVDDKKPTAFQLTGQINVLNQAEFAALYDSNPKESYPTYLYAYLSLATCYANEEEGYAAAGALLQNGGARPTIDSITQRDEIVYLNLGTTTKQQPVSVGRFHAASFVRLLIPFSTVVAYLGYSITDSHDVPVDTITDYTKGYHLAVRWISTEEKSAFVGIPEGTVLTVVLPDNLLPYLYLAGAPSVRIPMEGSMREIPVTNYSFSGNILTLTMPVELNMGPDSVCVPVKFLIPSKDLTITLKSLSFSKPLVYRQDPDSLLYGFTKDSLMFQVVPVTQGFVLKGAQLDTTGLTVIPAVYERGQAVTYTAAVNNRFQALSSDYCMAITVPTNRYNPAETSNNTLPAFITGINPVTPGAAVYFQTASKATAMDIFVMQTLSRPGSPTFPEYFNTVIVNRWTLYSGQDLPSDVVMLAACTKNVAQNSLARIDYRVVLDVPPGSGASYSNDAVFHYCSYGTEMEAQSNLVTIRNRTAEEIPVQIEPSVQKHPLQNDVAVEFDAYFNVPLDDLIFKSFTVTDILHPGVAVDLGSCWVKRFPDTLLPYAVSVDPAANTVTFEIENSSAAAGGLVQVHIAARVIDASQIPTDPIYQTPLFYNTVELMVNQNPKITTKSDPVLLLFTSPSLPMKK